MAGIRAELAGGTRKPFEPIPVICGIQDSGGDIRAHSFAMRTWVSMLSRRLDRPVLDRTGLADTYSFTLRYSPNDPLISRSPRQTTEPSAPDGRPMFRDALRDQLGLKLTPGRGPVDVLVVDRIEPPTPD